MSLRIACDLDGTLADMHAMLQHTAIELYGDDVYLRAGPGIGPVPPGSRALEPNELKRLWERVATVENFWQSLSEIEPGAIARLAQLTAKHRWELIFLTQRPSGAGFTVQEQSQRWLEAQGFARPSVFVVARSRGLIARALALDAVIDDRPENCFDVATDSEATPILVWRGAANNLPAAVAGSTIQVKASMAQALEWLEEYTVKRSAPRTMMGKLRRAIGLQSGPSR